MSDDAPRPRPTPYPSEPTPSDQPTFGPPPGWQPDAASAPSGDQPTAPGWGQPPHPQPYPQSAYGQYPGQPHPQQYGYPGYGYPPPAYGGHYQPKNGLGVAGMVCGIVGIPTAFIVWGFIPALLGLIFGLIGRTKAQRNEASNPGQALAGVICGAVGMVIAVGMLIFLLTYHDANGCGAFDNTGDCASN